MLDTKQDVQNAVREALENAVDKLTLQYVTVLIDLAYILGKSEGLQETFER